MNGIEEECMICSAELLLSLVTIVDIHDISLCLENARKTGRSISSLLLAPCN